MMNSEQKVVVKGRGEEEEKQKDARVRVAYIALLYVPASDLEILHGEISE